jgi:uroporphyrinogen III methyltransferase/synthase
VELPTIAFGPPDDFSALDRALATAGAFDWAVFASPTSVEYVLGRLGDLGGDARSFAGVRIAAVGPATAKALARRGLLADLTSPVATTPGLLEALASEGLTGARLLLPRTDIADDALPEGLERLGASVERVTAYRTSPPPGLEDAARVALARGLDLVCYSSSSTVNNLVASLGTEAGGLASVPSACIGPATADAARTAGLVVAVEAREHTIPGLIDAILEWRSRGGGIGS